MTNEELKRFISGRQKSLESKRSQIEDAWVAVSEYVNIGLGGIKNDLFTLDMGKKVFNGSAVSAAILATDGIHGYHVSPSFPWFSYAMSRSVLNKVPEIREWLQAEEQDVYSALNDSNFYAVMWSYILNGFTIGTSALYAEDDLETGRLVFEFVHPREGYCSVNKFGMVDVFHRKRKLSARQLVQRFGMDKMSETIKSAYQKDPFQEFEVLHAVYPREDYNPSMLGNKKKKYASVWYLTAGGLVLSESGFDEFPYKVWQYFPSGLKGYGLSPAILSMCDIKGANVISKSLYSAAELHVNPPLNVPSDMAGKVQWKPRGVNYYDRDGMIVKPAHTGGNFPVGLDREQALEASIRERFHVDVFLMLASLEGRGRRTAEEVRGLVSEKTAILGAELAPLNSALDQILDFVYYLLSRRHPEYDGAINPRPDILYDLAIEGDTFSPVYQGPLAQQQQRMFKTQGIQQGITMLEPVLAQFPESKVVVNSESLARNLMESFGFPQKTIRSEDEVAAIQQAQQEAMAQENQKQDMLDAAGGMKTLAEANETSGGALAQAAAQMGGLGA